MKTHEYIGLRAAYDEAVAGRLDMDLTLREVADMGHNALTDDPFDFMTSPSSWSFWKAIDPT